MLASGFFIKLGLLAGYPYLRRSHAGRFYWRRLVVCRWTLFRQAVYQKIGKCFSITEDKIETIKKTFHKHHNKILIISKLTMNFGKYQKSRFAKSNQF